MTDKQPLILIVDDEPDFLEIFGMKLTSAGFRVETAGDGESGIKMAKELKPDLILMDVKMPGVSGADAVLRLKSDPETKNIKVVFLSSLGDPRREIQEIDRRFAGELGADGYIKKSDDLNKTVDQIKTLLNVAP